MKMSRLVFDVLATLLFLIFSLHPASGQEFFKVIKKEFDISGNGTVSLSNIYGNVAVAEWERPRAKIETKIVVRASSESHAQRIFSRIKIAFTESRDYIAAATEVEAQKKNWWFWKEEDSDYTISYQAFIPPNCNLVVQNKHGNVDIDEIGGRAELSVRYGNLNVGQLQAEAELILEHGNGHIVRADKVRAEIQQGRFRIDKVRLLEADSRYSRIWVGQADEVLSKSKYDTYELGRVGRFVNSGEFDNIEIESAAEVAIDSRLSELYIERVNRSLRLRVDSSGVRVVTIGRSFNDVDVTGSFTDFRLGVEEGASYQMDAVADFAGIRYPRTMNITYEREAGTNHEVRGHVGASKASRLLRARVSYGALKVAQN